MRSPSDITKISFSFTIKALWQTNFSSKTNLKITAHPCRLNMGNSHGHGHHHRKNPIHNGANPKTEAAPPPPAVNKHGLQPLNQNQNQDLKQNTMVTSLPYAHVDSSLRALAGQAEGFGRFAIGGFHGQLYHVTTLSDDGPGSLRDGCRKKEPLWIVFEVSGTIHLHSYLSVSSYKTIDGRGQQIKLTGKGLRLKECEHVIVCNLEFEGGRGHDVDAIQIKPKSKHIWIDRCSLRDYDDGLIDITRESTDITISRCHFSQHDKTMLIGADPSHIGDRCIRVTIHHCFFDGTHQRHPRVRFGKVHLYNNYTRNWGIYAVCASVEAQIYSQYNIYEAAQKKVAFKYLTEKAADKEEAVSGFIRSEGDFFVSGTQAGLMSETVEHCTFNPREYYPTWTVEAPTDALKNVLQHYTGWQCVPRPTDQISTA
ncbi:probable pectate lyase 4 [Ricinus communis]|uniref:probable pectate lyase 4 n=1 Tax=Ricinus communis TaxID=3988 RepID=UPI00201A7F92|nr:probable pectate lyase 4 [Ricinus communis]